MYNWSENTKTFNKRSPEYEIWKLEQMINYGLGNDKLSLRALKKHFPILKIDPAKRVYLSRILAKQ